MLFRLIRKYSKISSFTLFICFLLNSSITFAEGFAKNTLVCVGHKKFKDISELKVGDAVVSVDIKNYRLVIDKVTHVHSEINPKYVEIFFEVDDVPGFDSFICKVDQKCFCPDYSGWIEAKHLSKGVRVLSSKGARKIASCTEINKNICTYQITLERYPHFFVGQRNFFVKSYIKNN